MSQKEQSNEKVKKFLGMDKYQWLGAILFTLAQIPIFWILWGMS